MIVFFAFNGNNWERAENFAEICSVKQIWTRFKILSMHKLHLLAVPQYVYS